MSDTVVTYESGEPTGVLAALGSVQLVLDTSGCRNLSLVIFNQGNTNSLTYTIEIAPNGDNFSEITTLAGTVAHNANSTPIIFGDGSCCFKKMRITISSASGTTYLVEHRGTN